MNEAAQAALAKVRSILAPRELSPAQRAACIAVRAHLLSLDCMVRDCNDAAGPLRGYLTPFNLAAVRQRLATIEKLLADDRRARATARAAA